MKQRGCYGRHLSKFVTSTHVTEVMDEEKCFASATKVAVRSTWYKRQKSFGTVDIEGKFESLFPPSAISINDEKKLT